MTAAIVNPETLQRASEVEIGEIWLQGPTKGKGYYKQIEATEETFEARIKGEKGEMGWLRTGDLGFRRGNSVFISGRYKVTHFPHYFQI